MSYLFVKTQLTKLPVKAISSLSISSFCLYRFNNDTSHRFSRLFASFQHRFNFFENSCFFFPVFGTISFEGIEQLGIVDEGIIKCWNINLFTMSYGRNTHQSSTIWYHINLLIFPAKLNV